MEAPCTKEEEEITLQMLYSIYCTSSMSTIIVQHGVYLCGRSFLMEIISSVFFALQSGSTQKRDRVKTAPSHSLVSAPLCIRVRADYGSEQSKLFSPAFPSWELYRPSLASGEEVGVCSFW